MSLIKYIFSKPLCTIRADIREFRKIRKNMQVMRRMMRYAREKITVDFGESNADKKWPVEFSGCIQKFWKWEYDDEMRNNVLREYETQCPYFNLKDHKCNQMLCEYNISNSLYRRAKNDFYKLKNTRQNFWRMAMGRTI